MKNKSNINKWNIFYDKTNEKLIYGDSAAITYNKGCDFLKDCKTIEDWGCGYGYFSKLVPAERYKGIDGSNSKSASVIADLVDYRSKTEGIFMRHILEHNYEWKKILANALSSFTKNMVLVIFTPFTEETKEIAFNGQVDVPDISFNKDELTDMFGDITWTEELNIVTETQYEIEHIFYLSK